jgi:NADH-quinone oxidoreductase subunit F
MTSSEIDLQALEPILARQDRLDRSQLLPVLIEAQRQYGYLGEEVVNAISAAMRIPRSEIYGVMQFFTMLYDRPTGRTHVYVCTGPACVMRGSGKILEEICRSLGVGPGDVDKKGDYMVEAAPCLGLCDQAPAALIGETPTILSAATGSSGWLEGSTEASMGFVAGEPRWLTGRCGEIDPPDVQQYEAHGGFAGLRKALLEMKPEEVVSEIKASGLVGRGGAAFPTGLKWQYTAAAEAEERFIVANGDESEPGTFKDRVLMEADPLSVLEGMAIAGYAIGAAKGYLYVRGEYPRAQRLLRQAIENARQAGFLGDDIQGSGFSFEVELRSGAGAYICGEETALFESIEGRRGQPRIKPPYPTTHGLFGKPTSINNIETLCTAAWIIANGVDSYRALGTEDSPGTKLFCLSGDVARPGVYEVPFGTRMDKLIELAGGVQGSLKGVLVGGAAGAFATPDQLNVAMSFEALNAAGLPLGSGVLMVISEKSDMRKIVRSLGDFFAHESCGKCLACQLGTQRQLEIIDRIGESKLSKSDIEALKDVGFTMTNASLCGLGMTAGSAILSALDLWPELFMDGASP